MLTGLVKKPKEFVIEESVTKELYPDGFFSEVFVAK